MVIILTVPTNDFRDSFTIDKNFILVTHARQLITSTNNNPPEANRHHQVESSRSKILKNSPSQSTARVRRNQETTNMRVDSPSMKRSASETSETKPVPQKIKRMFKTSGKVFASNSRQIVATGGNSTRQESWRHQANDTNNNSIVAGKEDDISNNIEHSSSWRRNIDSVNGTVDVSMYERNDIDRLYGDALLVYFKNFNE